MLLGYITMNAAVETINFPPPGYCWAPERVSLYVHLQPIIAAFQFRGTALSAEQVNAWEWVVPNNMVHWATVRVLNHDMVSEGK